MDAIEHYDAVEVFIGVDVARANTMSLRSLRLDDEPLAELATLRPMLDLRRLPVDPAPRFEVNTHHAKEIKCSSEHYSGPPLRHHRTPYRWPATPERSVKETTPPSADDSLQAQLRCDVRHDARRDTL